MEASLLILIGFKIDLKSGFAISFRMMRSFARNSFPAHDSHSCLLNLLIHAHAISQILAVAPPAKL